MAAIVDPHDQKVPTGLDEPQSLNASLDENRGTKRPRPSVGDDDDDDDDKGGRERRKIEIKFIKDKSRRHITFSKRKAGIMKKVGLAVLSSLASGRRMRAAPRAPSFVLVPLPPSPALLTTNPRRPKGIRTLGSHRHAGAAPRCVRDRPGLHIHDTKTPAARDQSRG